MSVLYFCYFTICIINVNYFILFPLNPWIRTNTACSVVAMCSICSLEISHNESISCHMSLSRRIEHHHVVFVVCECNNVCVFVCASVGVTVCALVRACVRACVPFIFSTV